ncbi:hypothetical protein TI39_contig4204g00001, partial [Zymoseptoria brevis]
MKSTISLAFAAVLGAASAGPIIAQRQSGPGRYGPPPSYGPPGYGPPPPAYGPSSRLNGTGGSTVTISSTSTVVVSPIAPTASSSLGSPIGGFNTTAFPMPTATTVTYTIPYTPSNSSLGSPIGATGSTVTMLPITTINPVPYPSANSSLGSPVGASSSPSLGLPTAFTLTTSIPLTTGGNFTLSPEQPSSTSDVTISVTLSP